MNIRQSALKLACAGSLTFAVFGLAAGDQAKASTVIDSGGYGLFASLIGGGDYGQIGEVNVLNEVAPGPYDAFSLVPSFEGSAILGPNVITISTGVLTAAASSPFPPTATGASTFTLNSVLMTLGAPGAAPLLEITARSLSGTASVSGIGSLSTDGSSTLDDVTISGSLIGAPISLPGLINPSVNDVLFNHGVEIVANAEGGYNNGTIAGWATIPLEVFISGSGAPGSLSGLVNFGFAYAQISTVPEPAAWIEALLGFGLMGAALRRRPKVGPMARQPPSRYRGRPLPGGVTGRHRLSVGVAAGGASQVGHQPQAALEHIERLARAPVVALCFGSDVAGSAYEVDRGGEPGFSRAARSHLTKG